MNDKNTAGNPNRDKATMAPNVGPRERLTAAPVVSGEVRDDVPTSADAQYIRPPRVKFVGPYQILNCLGEGGMGTVFRAEQQEPIRRFVAVKLVRSEFASDQIIARFEAERQALARMDHPNICKVLDAGSEEGQPYFVMELAPGLPVTRFCDENRLSIKDRIELFIQICEAIAHAHTKAILHRDIKSSNVMAYFADGKPTVKVIDFGVAKAMTQERLSDRLEVTQMGRAIGTYEAMSPEQVEGAADVDTRTDVYALGVLLYELLCGYKPFAGLMTRDISEIGIQQLIRNVEAPRPSDRISRKADRSVTPEIAQARRTTPADLERTLRNELEWVPMKAMRKDRDRRYSSPQEMAEDLRNYLTDRPLLAGPESRIYRLRKGVVRNRGSVITALLLLTGLTAGIVVYVRNIRAEQQRTTGALKQVIAEKNEARKQEAEAKKQAAIAEAVSNFQGQMINAADPERMLGDKVTVAQAVEAASNELDKGTLKDQPIVEAFVRRDIAVTLEGLGRNMDAEVQLRKAIKLLQESAPGDVELGRCLGSLGRSLRDQGKFIEAEQDCKEGLDIVVKTTPNDERTLAVMRNDLAMVYLNRGDNYGEAEKLVRQVVTTQEKTKPRYEGDTQCYDDLANGLDNLGFCLEQEGNVSEAEKVFRHAIEVCHEHLPANTPVLAANLGNVGQILKNQGRFAEAEPLFRQDVEIEQATLPPNHPDLASDMAGLAGLLEAEKKYDQAEVILRKTLAMRKISLPPGNPIIASNLTDLASVLVQEDRSQDAESLCREASAILEKTDPPMTFLKAANLAVLAQALDHENRPVEAEQTLQERFDLVRKDLPATERAIDTAAYELENMLMDHGKDDRALQIARQQLKYCQDHLPVHHLIIGLAWNGVGAAYLKSGQFADATEAFKSAEDCWQNSGTDPRMESMAIAGIGKSLQQAGKPGDAMPYIRKGLTMREQVYGLDHPATAASARCLADALSQMGKSDEATAVLVHYHLADATRPTGHP